MEKSNNMKLSDYLKYYFCNYINVIFSALFGSLLGLLLNRLFEHPQNTLFIIIFSIISILIGYLLLLIVTLSTFCKISNKYKFHELQDYKKYKDFTDEFKSYIKNPKICFIFILSFVFIFIIPLVLFNKYDGLHNTVTIKSLCSNNVKARFYHSIAITSVACPIQKGNNSGKLFYSFENFSITNPSELHFVNAEPIAQNDTLFWQIKIPNDIERKINYIFVQFLENKHYYHISNRIKEDTCLPLSPARISIIGRKIAWSKSASNDVKAYRLTLTQNNKKVFTRELCPNQHSFYINQSVPAGNYSCHLSTIDSCNNESLKNKNVIIK